MILVGGGERCVCHNDDKNLPIGDENGDGG